VLRVEVHPVARDRLPEIRTQDHSYNHGLSDPLFSAVTQLGHRKASVIATRSLYSDVELLQAVASQTIRLRYSMSVQYRRLLINRVTL
jgi:hypothetical protein